MNKYEPIRASEIKIEQLDRIEKKMDMVLQLLVDKESKHLYVRPANVGELRITHTD